MRILVSAASKHGSTAEIATRIAEALRVQVPGETVVDVRRPAEIDDVSGYDAAIIGSAVYMGRWLEEARDLATKAQALAPKPVWIFSSGPVGEPPKPQEEPVDVATIRNATQARDHHLFAGRLDRHALTFTEKAMAIALRAPEGDFRDWAEIDAWSAGIAADLTATVGGRR